ncbi:hypothetical protein ABPG72_009180 [Tetrahymena utriculariae]
MSLKSHQACSYAVLLLSDDGQAITVDNINKVLTKAKVQNVEKYLPKLYASNITPAVIASTIANGGTSGSAPAPIDAPAPKEAPKEEKKAPVKEEKKVEKEPEEDLDMGDLFG